MNLKSDKVDICLLLEGTYPFVRGGVSSWVHQIISSLPEFSFGLVFLGSVPSDYEGIRYELPSNVKHLETHYMFEPGDSVPKRRPAKFDLGAVDELHQYFRGEQSELPERARKCLHTLGAPGGIDASTFYESDQSWAFLREQNYAHQPDTSFVDYFWTVRTMHGPLFLMAAISEQVPEASVYHTISTGYAGLLGALLAQKRGKSLILSEHGIYTKERKIDLNAAQWIPQPEFPGDSGVPGDAIRRLWIGFYEGLGRLTYHYANPITSLFGGSQQRQIRDGASADKTIITPNGIDLNRFEAAYLQRPDEIPKVIGFIGRIVPIKDVKTFIRAMRIICDKDPEIEGWIIGSSDETPEYGAECEALTENLGLSNNVRFLGFQNVVETLPKIGLLALTSISEGQPLTILEGFAAGVPAVATDVGSCRELIEGMGPEDVARGKAGRVTPIASPSATAEAALELFSSDEVWYQAQAAALDRVKSLYALDSMIDQYRQIYREAC